MLSNRIFISKNASEIDPVRSQFDELGFEVDSHSFLSFSSVESDSHRVEIARPYDVIFFGSPRAVIFFKASQSISESAKITCIGEKTAELLESLGYEVAFRGEKSGEPKVVAEEFRSFLGNRHVLFPVSDRSLKTISSLIGESQKEEVVVYSTKVVGKLVEVSDVYVFTSPSNVEGFFLDNVIPENAEVIAWGKSTEAALISRAASVLYCLKNASFEELFAFLGQK